MGKIIGLITQQQPDNKDSEQVKTPAQKSAQKSAKKPVNTEK